MSKWKRKKQEWYKRKINKAMRRIRRKKNKHYSINKNRIKLVRGKKAPHILTAPSVFSLLNNINETVSFFDKVFNTIKTCQKGDWIFFDLSQVEIITPDAIMYLIAVVNNAKLVHTLRIHCSGNVPSNYAARQLIEKVGFYDYVRADGKHAKGKDTERIRIMQGYESSGLITSKICDFVNEKIQSDSMLTTKRLYPMLVEMMTNVKQHAYKDNKSTMFPKWYIYVENCERDIRFIFLDSGSGIPNTIRKNWTEKIKGFLNGDKDEPAYIEAVLKGEFRTETGHGYRGKGLPEIYSAVINPSSRLSQMTIVSGHAKCEVKDSNVINREYIYNAFEGSLFMWIYRKGEFV